MLPRHRPRHGLGPPFVLHCATHCNHMFLCHGYPLECNLHYPFMLGPRNDSIPHRSLYSGEGTSARLYG